MRKLALLAAGLPLLVFAGGAPLPAAAQSLGTYTCVAPGPCGSLGSPFEEQLGNQIAPYSQDYTIPADGTSGSTEWCYQSNLNGAGYLTCKPAAVSASVLPDGRVLYWNGLSGLENVQHVTALEGAWASSNSEARLLYVNGLSAAGSPQFAGPCPATVASSTSAPCLTTAASVTNPDLGAAPYSPLPGGNGCDPSGQFCSNPSNPNAQIDLFCSDQVMLSDGTLLVTGGTWWHNTPDLGNPSTLNGALPNEDLGVVELQGLRTTRIFDPSTNTFNGTGAMNYGRWYPGLIELPSGDVFVGGGVRKLIQTDGTNVRETETYHVSGSNQGTWTVNDNGTMPAGLRSGDAALPLFPRFFLLPNGDVYYGGDGQQWGPFGWSGDEPLYGLHQAYDPSSKTWDNTDYGAFGIFGARSGAFSVMLPLHPDAGAGNAYDQVQILTGGGTLGPPPGGEVATNLTDIETLNFDPATSRLLGASDALGPQTTLPRWYSASVILPNDDIAVFSGADKDEVVMPGTESPVHQVEVYSHVDGKFHATAWDTHDRTYHNTAILLPDGSVLVGGHSPINAYYGNSSNQTNTATQTLAGADGNNTEVTSNNFKDPSFEIYRPEYFGSQYSRPELEYAPSRVSYGSAFPIAVNTEGNPLSGVRLVRLPAQTHITDGNMRSVDLSVLAQTPDPLHPGWTDALVAAPPSASIAPSAPYYLFANTRATDGTTLPSFADVVNVGGAFNSARASAPFGIAAAAAHSGLGPAGGLANSVSSHHTLANPDAAERRAW